MKPRVDELVRRYRPLILPCITKVTLKYAAEPVERRSR